MKFTRISLFKIAGILVVSLLVLVNGCAEPEREIVDLNSSLKRDIEEIDKGLDIERILRKAEPVAISTEKDPFKSPLWTPPPEPNGKNGKEPEPVEEEISLILTGILRGFDQAIAIIWVDEETYAVKENDEICGYLVENIGEKEITLVSGERKLNLKLGEDNHEKE